MGGVNKKVIAIVLASPFLSGGGLCSYDANPIALELPSDLANAEDCNLSGQCAITLSEKDVSETRSDDTEDTPSTLEDAFWGAHDSPCPSHDFALGRSEGHISNSLLNPIGKHRRLRSQPWFDLYPALGACGNIQASCKDKEFAERMYFLTYNKKILKNGFDFVLEA